MNYEGEEFWRLKITAFLHAPPHKALLLGQKIAHEPVAQELIKAATGTSLSNDQWESSKLADRIAAAADRKGVQPEMETFWSAQPKLIHPLSGKHFDLMTLRSVDSNDLTDRVRGVIEAAKSLCGNSRTMFLWLWRCLADMLKHAEDDIKSPEQRLGALWDLLPADTRIPDHTIWHHNRIVSAFAGSLPRPSLLLMSLGPVQSFISCARKTRDLWAGSYILAYLAWKGMRTVAERFGPDAVLFPDLRHQPFVDRWLCDEIQIPGIQRPSPNALQVPSLPNRWIAVLPAEEVTDVARVACEAMRAGWTSLADQTLQSFPDLAIDPSQLQRQLNWLEIYWASVECPDVTSNDADALRSWVASICARDADFERLIEEFGKHRSWRPNLGSYYGRIHSAVGELHASRKLLREFGMVEEPGYKCTLCGIREPLRPEALDSGEYSALTGWWISVGSRFDSDTESDGRERLCAVCAAKRLSGRVFGKSLGIVPRFPSTSEIAATTFKASILAAALNSGADGLRVALRDFCESSQPLWESETEAYVVSATERQMHQLIHIEASAEKYWRGFAHLDGEWLFPERYAAEARATSGQGSRLTPKQIISASSALGQLRNAAERAGIAPPSPYYAVLMFDGDRMGDWVAGRHPSLPQIKEVLHPDIAREELGESYNAIGSFKRPQSPALQGALSAALLGFACDVSRFAVERAPGSEGVVVYSGGDDVLAFAPIASALKMACLLRRCFSESTLIERDGKVYTGTDATSRWGRNGRIHLGMGDRATASAGIAIAHHLQPLSQVLEAGRVAERAAKDALGRDAFSVTLLKRSGEQIEAGAKWEDLPRLIELICMFSSDELSPHFVHQLAEEEPTLANLGPESTDSEIQRMLKRHLKMKEKAAPVAKSLPKLIARHGLRQSLKLLSLATFIARHSSVEVDL